MCTFTWNEYLNDVKDFLQISERLNDKWSLYKKNDHESGCFLVYKQKITFTPNEPTINLAAQPTIVEEIFPTDADSEATASALALQDMVQMEYHIVYSISYQVPVLYFQAHKRDGRPLGLEDAWRLFRSYDLDNRAEYSRADMLSILTQMEHPVLFRPFLALHPCRTAELLAQAGASRNRVLTFISLMGPFVQLNLSNEYGLLNAGQPVSCSNN